MEAEGGLGEEVSRGDSRNNGSGSLAGGSGGRGRGGGRGCEKEERVRCTGGADCRSCMGSDERVELEAMVPS